MPFEVNLPEVLEGQLRPCGRQSLHHHVASKRLDDFKVEQVRDVDILFTGLDPLNRFPITLEADLPETADAAAWRP